MMGWRVAGDVVSAVGLEHDRVWGKGFISQLRGGIRRRARPRR